MRLGIARTAVAVASSAGLVVGAATSAGAAGFDRPRDHNRHRGWVNVCQDINEHHGSHGKDRDHDRPRYHGAYKVEDSSYRAQYVDLYGRYDCDQVEVRAGRVHVSVTMCPTTPGSAAATTSGFTSTGASTRGSPSSTTPE